MFDVLLEHLKKFNYFNLIILDSNFNILYVNNYFLKEIHQLYNIQLNDNLLECIPVLNNDKVKEHLNGCLNGNINFIKYHIPLEDKKNYTLNALLVPHEISNHKYILILFEPLEQIDNFFDFNQLSQILHNLTSIVSIDHFDNNYTESGNIFYHIFNIFSSFLPLKDILYLYNNNNEIEIYHYDNNKLSLINTINYFDLIKFNFFDNKLKFRQYNEELNEFLDFIFNHKKFSNYVYAYFDYEQKNFKQSFLLLSENIINEQILDYLHLFTNIIFSILNKKFLSIKAEEIYQINNRLLSRYNNLFTHLKDPYALHKIITDENNNPIDYVFVEVNPAFCEMLKVNENDIVGKNILSVWPSTEKYWIDTYGKVALTGQSIEFENYSSTFNKYFRVSAFSPEKYYFVTLFHDITENIIRQQELEIAKEKAEENSQLKTDFINNLSHELRTPLNGIIGFLDLIVDNNEVNPDKLNRYFHIIKNSAYKLLNIVDNILNISQIETKQTNVIVSYCNLNEILKELYNTYFTNLNKNVELKLNLPLSDNFAILKTDNYKLKQVCKQLIDNCVKFTHQGIIEFGYTIEDNFLKLYFKDTGIGIDEKFINKIFEPYFQIDGKLSRHYSGNGIGLAIVKHYLELLNFEFIITSKKNVGTNFEINIPKKYIVNQIPILENNVKQNRKYNILIAEDENINFEIFNLYLSQHFNADIFRVNNGIEAIEFMNNTNMSIDIILMDIKMPFMDGIETTNLLRQKGFNCPIIALTALSTNQIEENISLSGFNDIIYKPINKKTFIEKISTYLKV